MLRMTAICGWNCCVVSSWKLETSSTDHVSSVLSSMSDMTGTPILPPTRVGSPAALRISPTSVVVVVLPLEPVIGQDLSLEEARGQLQLADYGQPEAAHLNQFRRVQGNARTDHDEVLASKGQQPVTTGLDVDAFFEQRGNIFGQRLGAANVGDCNLCAATTQKQRRGQTGFPQSYDQYLLALELHHRSTSGICGPRLLYSAPHRQRANESLLSSLRRQSQVG